MDSSFVYSFVNTLNKIHSSEKEALERLLLTRVPLKNNHEDDSTVITTELNEISPLSILNSLIYNCCKNRIAVDIDDKGNFTRFSVLKEPLK